MITVHKLNHVGVEKTAYHGSLIERSPTQIVLDARWQRDRLDLGYVTFATGDRFIEYFYTDRWYNIFAIFEAETNVFRGWYCNITRPARVVADHLWAEDLALDYFRQPDGTEFILDEEEFSELGLNAADTKAARAALAELQLRAARQEGPFDLDKLKGL